MAVGRGLADVTLFAEFRFELDPFPLARTLSELADLVVEIERVVVSEEVLTPYFWVATDDLDEFEAVAKADSTIEDLHRLDVHDGEALFRAEWSERVEETIYTFAGEDVVVLEASGDGSGWEVRVRFDARERLVEFRTYCEDNDISSVLNRLYSETRAMTAGQYGLTEKQRDALVTAWNAGYFESPRAVTLEEVADSLGITHQSLSQRLRRAHHELIANTLVVTPPSGETSDDV